ncbi:MAG: glycosyltransferase [Kiritimatiellae bacterium]|nr:glycosyltransferase [Kiritimatiellia bacterium]
MEAFSQEWRDLSVILSHDWLTGMRGGERVLEVLCRWFPRAPIFTLFHNPAAVSSVINSHPITTSWLQSVPGIFRVYRLFLPFFPGAIERLKPPKADLLISTSHCVAKGLNPGVGTRHLCYCFTPMRYVWLFQKEYFHNARIKSLLATPILATLRRWDQASSRRVHHFVAISRHVQKRISDFYGRNADVVYPPVDLERFTPGPRVEGGFDLVVSALVPYKRIDLAVRAYTRLGYPLRIVGTGTELKKLQALAGANVRFMGWQSDDVVCDLYRACRLLVFPGEEDLGLVPLEAQACGRPVVAFRRGGALETVVDDVTGVFFDQQTEESLLDAVARCAAKKWDVQTIRRNAERFSVTAFVAGLAQSIAKCMRDYKE